MLLPGRAAAADAPQGFFTKIADFGLSPGLVARRDERLRVLAPNNSPGFAFNSLPMNWCTHAIHGQPAVSTAPLPGIASLSASAPVRFEVFATVGQLPVADWLAVANDLPKPLTPECLALLETKGDKYLTDHRYLIGYQQDVPVACFCFHAMPLGSQWLSSEFLKRLPFVGLIARALSCNCMLLCGNPFLTGPLGYAVAPHLSPEEVASLAQDAVAVVRRAFPRAEGVLFKDVPEDVSAWMQARGLIVAPAQPNMVLPLAPEWTTFQDYTAAMSTKYRQRVTSTYKKSAALTTERLTADQALEMQDELYRLFLHVFRDGTFTLAEPGRNYLPELRARMKEACSLVLYRLEGKPVAFRTVLLDGDSLDCHFVGYDATLNHDYKLYQRMLYDYVADGLALGLREVRFGRTATEIKSTVGALPRPLENLTGWFRPGVRHLARRMMRKIEMPEYVLRHPFKEVAG